MPWPPSRLDGTDGAPSPICTKTLTDAEIRVQRRQAILAAEAIMHSVLGYLPDESGDAREIRARIEKWLARDVVRNA